MKACIIDPYLDTLGGGERYALTLARVICELGYSVDVQWSGGDILKKAEDRFGIDLKNIKIVSDARKGDGYDLAFWVSDGSIPLLRARNNWLHFQVPFKDVDGKSLLNKMKMFRINQIICNSQFTKKVIDTEYGVNSVIVYPPIDVEKIKPKRKENIILYVGRFSNLLQSKNQDLLVEEFAKLNKTDWKLVLAGSNDVGGDGLVEKIKKLSRDLNVEVLTNISSKDIFQLYARAKIFWSASGFGVNDLKNPEKMEHFGITVVEAMSGGVVPVIFDGGGYTEIVENGVNGFLFSEKSELVFLTNKLISDKKMLKNISEKAMERSKRFSYEKFRTSIANLL